MIWKIGLSSTTMEIIKNNKGGSKLWAEGYFYTKISNSTRIRWECSQRNAFFCAHIDLEVKQLLYVTEHCHDPDPNKVKAAKVKNTIKTVAVTNVVRFAFFLLILIVLKGISVKTNLKIITEGVFSYFALSLRILSEGFCPLEFLSYTFIITSYTLTFNICVLYSTERRIGQATKTCNINRWCKMNCYIKISVPSSQPAT